MVDLNEISDDALEALLKNPDKIADAVAEEQPPAPPEPPQAQEPEPEKPIEEPPPAEPTPEPEVDIEKEHLKAVVAELEARQRAMDSKIGRFAGEADYWRKQAEKGKARPEQAPDPADTYEAEPQEPEPRAAKPAHSDSLSAWAVQQAIGAGAAQFQAEHPEAAELNAEMAEYISKSGYNPARIFDSADPMLAQKESYRVLEEALWQVKAARSAKLRQELEQKRTEQFARQKEAKQRASISASGSVPAPRATPKTLNDLTDAELDAELKRLSV